MDQPPTPVTTNSIIMLKRVELQAKSTRKLPMVSQLTEVSPLK